MQSIAKQRKLKNGYRAWVVYWAIREDKVGKDTGTVICLLPWMYTRDAVGKIVEAIYSSYVYTYTGHLDYACFRKRRKNPLARRRFDERVVIGENPGLVAELAEDVVVESNASGLLQTISWKGPDFYEPGLGGPIKVQDGSRWSFTFDFFNFKQTDEAKTQLGTSSGRKPDAAG